MKTLRRAFSAAAALVVALSMAVTAFADDEKKKDDKKTETIEFEFDESRITEENEPVISFDGSGFENYIHLTRDANKAGLAVTKITTGCFQGNSLKVTAACDTGVEGSFSVSGLAGAEDALAVDEVNQYNIVGIELRAEDFGLSCFDGCFVNFVFKMTDADEEALLGQSIYVYGADSKSKRLTDKFTQLKFNKAANDTVTKYNTTAGALGVPVNCGATKLIFDMPISGALNGDVMFLDNITIKLPGSAAENSYLKNIDSFNPTAKQNTGGEAIEIKETKEQTVSVAETELTSKEKSPMLRVFILIVVVIVLGAGIAIFLRTHKKYY